MSLWALPTELVLLVLIDPDINSLLAAESTYQLLYNLVRENESGFNSLFENAYRSIYIHRKRGSATYRQLTREKYTLRRACQGRLPWSAEEVGNSLLELSAYLKSDEQLEKIAQEAVIILQENRSCPISERQEALATALMAQNRDPEAREMYKMIFERDGCLPWSKLLTASRWGRHETDLPHHEAFSMAKALLYRRCLPWSSRERSCLCPGAVTSERCTLGLRSRTT